MRKTLLTAIIYNRISTLTTSATLSDAHGIRAYHIFNAIGNLRIPRIKGAKGWDQYVVDLTGGMNKRGEFVNLPWWCEVVDRQYSEEVGADMVKREEVEANPEKYGVDLRG